ncbi:MAG: TerC family protein [Bdellovibrionaceae bacterium]|nr:TerC family protein [Pseudobdellovibrionaceae bacterium]
MFFPFAEYWWFYAAFIVFVLAVLALDLGVFHKHAHEVSFKEASAWTAIWISLALVFNFLFYLYAKQTFSTDERIMGLVQGDPDGAAWRVAMEFLTGFVVEKSLAVDNIFVFAVVFGYFGIPRIYQHRILFYGILGALIFRAIFIALGTYLMAYHAVVLFFGALLIFTGFKMFFSNDDMMEPEKNWALKLLRKFMRIHPKIEGEHFFTRINGVLHATPLFVALVFLELSDILFAVDSVPAIFALTDEPLIVFTSNIFAILGLRSMYFMLSGVMERFSLIKYGLAAVLIFVGLKMVYLNDAFGGKFPISWSLAIIVSLIGSSIVISWFVSKREDSAPKSE